MTESDIRLAVIGVEGGWSSERLADAVAERTGERCLVDPAHLVADLDKRSLMVGGLDLLQFDGLVVKKLGATYSPDLLDRLELLRFAEASGVRVFSRPDVIGRLLDRLSCTVTLRAAGIPMPPTVVTENPAQAADVVRRFGETVVKPLYTTKARGMRVLKPSAKLGDELAQYQSEGNPFFYLQKRIDLPGRDLGIVFLGGEYLGSYARVAGDKSWHTSTSRGGKYAACEPGDDIIRLAHDAQELFDLDFTSVDVAETADGPVVFEVAAFGGFRGLLEACGIDAAQKLADYCVTRIADASRHLERSQ